MRQQVAPQAGLSYSINDIGVIGRAMHVLASLRDACPCFRCREKWWRASFALPDVI
jgi:hypothetical protein